jgi:hypothetical protein
MRLKLLFITVILFLGCVETYGKTTILSFTFENTRTVTTNNADNIARNLSIDETLLTGTTAANIAPPTVISFTPANNATGVPINGNLIIVFNENITRGKGNIVIKRFLDDAVFETIDVENPNLVSVSGATVTINPAGTFVNATAYYVEISKKAIEDTANNQYDGINDKLTWKFTAVASPNTIWTNPIIGQNPSRDNPYTIGDFFNNNITVSGISRGTGIGSNLEQNSYTADSWDSPSLVSNKYFEFTLTPNAGYEIDFIDFTYTSKRSDPSIAKFAFRSSDDNFVTNIGTPDFDGTTISLSGEAYQNRTSATTFRIYAWGADKKNETFSINDFIFKGTVTQTTIDSDYFRSKSTGAWTTAANWESSRDNINWVSSTLAPTTAANTITIRNTHKITISSPVTADQIIVENGATLALNGANLTLNDGTGTDLTINSGGTFDNGGENQIRNGGGSPSISITGTFITRAAQGFVGPNTAIPSITTTLESGSTVEYGLAGNQTVQGTPIYQNITFSGSGTKTLVGTNSVAGTVTIKDTAILNIGNHTFGGTNTNLTMSGSSRFITSGTGTKPDMGGTYSLSGGVIEFANNSATTQTIRNKSYQNIEITGSNVRNSNGNITINDNGTFTVKNGGVFTINADAIEGPTGTQTLTVENGGTFKTGDADGFNGGTTTSVKNNIENINLNTGSTVEYSKDGDQIISLANYSNLVVSGTTGIKTLASNTDTVVGNNLTVKNGATLQIESRKTVTVTNNIAIDPSATMSLENGSNLVQINDNASNSGKITYKRNTAQGIETDYTYWSTPVADQTLFDVSPLTKKDKFFSFNPATNNWVQEDTSLKMTLGKGYIIRGIPAPPGSTSPRFYTVSFYGKPNNGVINVPIIWDGTSAEGSSNLIGNPYPSAIDADKFLFVNKDVIEGTIYFWTHNTDLQLRAAIIASGGTPGTGAFAYTSDDYATYNATGGTTGSGKSAISDSNLSSPGADLSKIPNGKIAAGQAFFTTSLKTNPISQVIFNNSMRLDKDSKVMDNSQFFKTKNSKTKKTTFEKHRIWLNLTNPQGAFKQILVGYITDATNGYDTRFDGESFDGNKFVDFYSLNKEKKLAIQGRALPFNQIDEVPLGFRTTINGTFTINIDQADGVLTNQAVFIEDKLTNTIADLRSAPFTFNTTAGTFNNRFVLRYTNNTLKTKDLEILENKVLVSNKNKQLKVNSKVEPIDKVMVYDLMGRLVFEKDKINTTEFSILNSISKSETLLVKVTLQNGETVTRKILY